MKTFVLSIVFGTLFVTSLQGIETLPVPNAAWFAEAEQRLQLPSPPRVAETRAELRSALDQFESVLDTLPNGVILRRHLRLEHLHEELAAAKPQAKLLDEIEAACRIRVVATAEATLHRLREAISIYRGIACTDEASLLQAKQALQTLKRFVQASGAPIGAEDEVAIREAYAVLARSRLLDDWLREFHDRFSLPNHGLLISKRQLETIGASHYVVPLNIQRPTPGNDVHAKGQVRLTRTLELMDSPKVAALRVRVVGEGNTAIAAIQPRSAIAAHSQERLQGTQSFQLTADGIVMHPPQVRVSHASILDDVSVAARCRLGSRLRQRIAERKAQEALADSDARVAADAEKQIGASVNAQTQDIADRVNSIFRRMYWENLEVISIEPRIQTSSTSGGVSWQAELAMPHQLGALNIAPIPTTIAAHADLIHVLHESAINNFAPAWRGRQIDEAIWRAFIRERFKLQCPETTAVPRSPASLFLADQQPFKLQFRGNQCVLTLHLQAYETEPAQTVSANVTVRAVYEVVATRRGTGLQRVELVCNGESGDRAAPEVVERFLPAQWEPLPRFNNTVSPQKLSMQQIIWQDGWLITAASHAGQDVSSGANAP